MKVWWCNQGESWAIERAESVICGSKDTAKRTTYRETVGQIRPGDITVHYVSPNLVAVSLAKSSGRYYDQLPLVGKEDRGSGWRAEVEYFVFHPVIPKSEFKDGLLAILRKYAPKSFPLNKDGEVMQGYLFPFLGLGVQLIRDSFKTVWPAWVPEFWGGEEIPAASESTPEPTGNGQS